MRMIDGHVYNRFKNTAAHVDAIEHDTLTLRSLIADRVVTCGDDRTAKRVYERTDMRLRRVLVEITAIQKLFREASK